MKPSRLLPVALLSLPLAACGAGGVVPQTRQPAPPAGPPASAFMKTGPLMGMDARHLTQMLGTPRLDIRESTMRKLQFANGRCVLDAYLYPPGQGKEPVVTHVDARAPSGADVDPAGCATSLQGR
ncbi:hypothetical protein [Sphingobium cloacae]|uniref:Lipoprotein SmpA/OmlA domain-containing protein n=1 Tax=Sphingobium cloacae TaxID=120107 RepID=A0A1E1F3V4_9SPHN|nr:hypothetical protein [Sphingobium cloacae]BAV65152.1 hypothetical protein SCLO_1021120 [Sphingobium cloacae]